MRSYHLIVMYIQFYIDTFQAHFFIFVYYSRRNLSQLVLCNFYNLDDMEDTEY